MLKFFQMNHHRTTFAVFTLLLAAVLVFNLRMLAPFLLAVMMGAIIAVITEPFYRWLCTHKLGPRSSGVIVVFSVFLLLVAPIGLLSVHGVHQGVDYANKIAADPPRLPSLDKVVQKFDSLQWILGNKSELDVQLRKAAQSLGKHGSEWILNLAGKLPGFLLQIVLMLTASYFFLVDGARLGRWLKTHIPIDADIQADLFQSFKVVTASSLWSATVAATVKALLMLTSFLALGVPGAVFAAGMTFFLSWVPIVGTGPVWGIATAYLYFESETVRGTCMLVMGIIISLSDNVLQAWLLKGKSNLHPLVALISIFSGIHMFGIVGIIVGPIIASILISFFDVWPKVRIRAGLNGEKPISAPSSTLSMQADDRVEKPILQM